MHKRKITLISGVFCLVIACSLATSFAVSNNNEKKKEKSIKVLEHATKGKFGKHKVIKELNHNNESAFLVADDQFEYKVKKNNSKIMTLQVKKYDQCVSKKKNINKKEAIIIGENLAMSYNPPSENCSYVLENATYRDNGNGQYYELTYNEVNEFGRKTGEGIAIDINGDGELVGLAVHEGNAEVAANIESVITEERAIEIAMGSIKETGADFRKNDMNNMKTELNVWDDKLCWIVEGETEQDLVKYGFVTYVNAVDGTILFKDSYCALTE